MLQYKDHGQGTCRRQQFSYQLYTAIFG